MQRLPRSGHSGSWTAAAFAAWSTLLLLAEPDPGPALVVVPVGFAIGGWLVRRHVAAGAPLVRGVQATGLLIGAPHTNASGLLPALCVRATGMQVELVGELPDATGPALTVHRIVHEALANSARHFPGARVRVRREEGDGQVAARGSGSGGRPDEGMGGGAGFGLSSLAARVRLRGGTLEAGPTATGFDVVATLPVPASVPIGQTESLAVAGRTA